MNLLLSSESPLLRPLAIIGAVLVALLLIVVVFYYLSRLFVGKSGQSVKKETNTYSNDLETARQSVGYEKHDDTISFNKNYDPLQARIEEDNLTKPVVAAKTGKTYGDKTKQSKDRIFDVAETKDEFKGNDNENSKNIFAGFVEEDSGEKAFDTSSFDKPAGTDSAAFFSENTENDNPFESFKFQDETTADEKVLTENDENFAKTMELLNKNLQNKNETVQQPVVERELIESIARDQIGEMLKAKESERNEELAKMESELRDLKKQLKSEKDKESEVYLKLQAAEEAKEEEMSRVADEISALRHELERERQALAQEREMMKREAQLAKKYGNDSENEEVAAIKREFEKQKEELARERAEMVKLLAELESKTQGSSAYQKPGAYEQKADSYKQQSASDNSEVTTLKRDLEKQKQELARERAETLNEVKRIKEQYALYQAEIDRQNKEAGERIARDSREKAEAEAASVNELFERMQNEINELKQSSKNKDKNVKETETKNAVETSELASLMAELIEERKNSRAEAEILRLELEAERMDSQKKLQEQFELLKAELDNRKSDDSHEYSKKIAVLKHEHEENERALRQKYDVLKLETEEQVAESIKQNEEAEQYVKSQYDLLKMKMAQEASELAQKNEELLRELEAARAENEKAKEGADKILETERARLQEQVKAEYEENEKMLNEKYMQLRTELQRESKQLADKRDEIENEKEELRKTKERLQQNRTNLTEQNADAMAQLEKEKTQLKQELAKREKELERAHAEMKAKQTAVKGAGSGLDKEEIRAELQDQLQKEYQEKEQSLRKEYDEIQLKLKREEELIRRRQEEILLKEKQIIEESTRLAQESTQVTTLITEKIYTKEERNRILMDYRSKIDVLRERLRVNEKATRENNKEYVPLRRIRDTLERDLKLLRKREAIVAKQQVMLYGVNNITDIDPERIKKLDQDVKQLAGLQHSVSNCEEILTKNKDRYPTLENLSKVLSQQNKQLRADIDEMEHAITFFESNVTVEE